MDQLTNTKTAENNPPEQITQHEKLAKQRVQDSPLAAFNRKYILYESNLRSDTICQVYTFGE